jgi:hypothetical protein
MIVRKDIHSTVFCIVVDVDGDCGWKVRLLVRDVK